MIWRTGRFQIVMSAFDALIGKHTPSAASADFPAPVGPDDRAGSQVDGIDFPVRRGGCGIRETDRHPAVLGPVSER